MESTKEGYGDFIKKHRIASGYKSQRALAEKSGISNASISRMEQELHKPEKRTVQTLAEYLPSTSYVELMVVCGYWSEDELLEDIVKDPEPPKPATRIEIKETPTPFAEELVKSLDLSDEELLKQFDLKIDGQHLTKEETQGIIAYIRSLRQMQS